MERHNIENIFRLTPLQEGFFFQNKINPNSSQYILQYLLKAESSLDATYIRISFDLLARKYDVLRSAFVMSKKSNHPLRVILNNRAPELLEEDISDTPVKNHDSVCEEIRKRDLQRGFDLQNDSLLRVTIIRTSPKTCFLLWTVHHIIVDGWCTSYIFRDVMQFYARLSAGEPQNVLLDEINAQKTQMLDYTRYIKWIYGQDQKKSTAILGRASVWL